MRRSGSSSCMLRPKSEVDEGTDKMSVTLINTEPLPSYSVERFYMLSEIEVNAHSTTFLCDELDETTQDTAESSEASLAEQQQHSSSQPSLYSILYVLWRTDQISSVRAFCEGPLAAAVKQCKSVVSEHHNITTSTTSPSTTSRSPESSPTRRHTTTAAPTGPQIYLVVELAALPDESIRRDNNDDEDAQQRHFQVKVDTAERLARYVAQSQEFRYSVSGITVGISNHVRAAPGLEACLDAFLVGASQRRTNSSETKSLVGLVALRPSDLLGMQDETVTDAAQGVLQSRTCAEWNGHGNLQTFARRAHSAWCVAHGVEEISSEHRKQTRRRRDGLFDGEYDLMDPILLWMIIFFVGYVLSQVFTSFFAEAATSRTAYSYR